MTWQPRPVGLDLRSRRVDPGVLPWMSACAKTRGRVMARAASVRPEARSMTVTVFRRPPRLPGPSDPQGELLLEAPPEIAETAGGANLGPALMYLPMAIGPAMFMFS